MHSSLIKEEERHILSLLPVLLKRDSRFKTEIYTILLDTFATKDDFARILEEMRIAREESNKRFDAQREEIRLHREETNNRFEEQSKATALLTKTVEKMGMSIRTIGARWGTEAEVTIRKTLQELLLKDLKIAQVSEWKAKDKEGMVGAPNAEIQVDLLMRNGEHYLVEIKSSADSAHVERLYKIGQFYTEKIKIKPKLLFVAVTMEKTGILLCRELGIQLITYDELTEED
ncbi:MAG: DUF3782 domain-containing protein [Nitrospirota bacterium]